MRTLKILLTLTMLLTAAPALASGNFLMGMAVGASMSGGKNWKGEYDRCRSAIAEAFPEHYEAGTDIVLDALDAREMLRQCQLPHEIIPLTPEQELAREQAEQEAFEEGLRVFLIIIGITGVIAGAISALVFFGSACPVGGWFWLIVTALSAWMLIHNCMALA